jgi:recombination protein RecT
VVQATQSIQDQANGAQRALVAVTHEIDNRLAIVGASAAAGIKPERLKLVALGAFTRTPSLWTCNPISVARAIVEAAQLGLEPTGLLGGAYLVPRGGEATLLVGYRGLVMLAKRSGEVQRVEARVVRQKDTFDYGYGLEPYLHHVPSQDADPGPYTGAYAVIFYRDGSRQFDYMSIAEIEAIRKRSAAASAGPWVTDYAEMCKKTPLRRLMKMAPLTIEVASRLDELDPEVGDQPAAAPANPEQAKIRAELQAALEREYGEGVTEGDFREAPATTQGDRAGTPEAPAGQPAEGAAAAPSAEPQAPQEPAAGAPQPAAAPVADPAPAPVARPESVAQIVGNICGIHHEGLGVGPCVLPSGHQQAEHQEAGGVRWTMPARPKA